MLDIFAQRLETARQAGHTRTDLDSEQEAATLFWLMHGLVGPLLVGLYTPEAAQSLLDTHLDQIFR